MFATGNLVSTIGAYVIGIGMLVFLYAVVTPGATGRSAAANPWGAKTLEWQVPTPVPLENFAVLPVVTGDFYGYGERTQTHRAGTEARRGLPRRLARQGRRRLPAGSESVMTTTSHATAIEHDSPEVVGRRQRMGPSCSSSPTSPSSCRWCSPTCTCAD